MVDGAQAGAAIAKLGAGSRGEARDLLRLRGVAVDAVRALPRRVDGRAPGSGEVRAVLAEAFRRTGPGPEAVVLIIYLVHECEDVWESSYRYEPIQRVLRELPAAWGAADLAEPPLPVAAALAAAALLDQEIAIEDALTTISLAGVARAAGTAAGSAARLAELAQAARPQAPELAGLLAERAAAVSACAQALTHAAQSADRFLRGDTAGLAAATRFVREQEQLHGPLDPTRRSEVRSHRLSLQRLAATEEAPWLTVDLAKLTYLYPFGVRRTDQQQVVRAVYERGSSWKLAGAYPVAVRDWLSVDDMWEGSDLRRRRFEGVVLELPGVTVDLGGTRVAELTAELRFSQLGNHTLRFGTELAGAGPQEVYAALFRAAPQHGRAEVRCGRDAPAFDRLSDLAADIIATLPTYLDGAGVSSGRNAYHVILSVLEASVGTGPGSRAGDRAQRRPISDGRDLLTATGSQVLLNPVMNAVGAISEWCRYRSDLDCVVKGVGRAEDLVTRTCNTTVLVMPGAPEFVFGTYESVAEFVASLDGMFAAWHDELTYYYQLVLDWEMGNGPAEDPEAHGNRLQDFVADARSVLALISSPKLVGSPVDAEIVSRFLATSGFDAVRADFNAKVDEVLGDRFNRTTAAARVKEEQFQQHQQNRVTTMIAVIAAVGVSGMFQLLQAGFDWQRLGAIVLFSLVVIIAASVGLLAHRYFRTH